MNDEQRDVLRREILQILQKNRTHYCSLEKKVIATCYPYATRSAFHGQFQYLIKKGCIQRISRGVYQITLSGTKYLEFLT